MKKAEQHYGEGSPLELTKERRFCGERGRGTGIKGKKEEFFQWDMKPDEI